MPPRPRPLSDTVLRPLAVALARALQPEVAGVAPGSSGRVSEPVRLGALDTTGGGVTWTWRMAGHPDVVVRATTDAGRERVEWMSVHADPWRDWRTVLAVQPGRVIERFRLQVEEAEVFERVMTGREALGVIAARSERSDRLRAMRLVAATALRPTVERPAALPEGGVAPTAAFRRHSLGEHLSGSISRWPGTATGTRRR